MQSFFETLLHLPSARPGTFCHLPEIIFLNPRF